MSSPSESDSGRTSEHGHLGHSHGINSSSSLREVTDSRLLWAVLINQFLTVGQVAAGLISGSVALLSDAAHNFNDANALLIAYVARRYSRKPADEQFTFGYGRAELVGALINLTLLAAIGLYLVYEGISRFIQPEPIVGWLMAAAAVLAIVVDFATAFMLWSMSRGSLNIRTAFVHNMVDALGSIGVLLGAVAIIWWDWYWIDPLITLLIAGYVLWQVAQMLPQAVRILMNGTPPWIDFHEVEQAMRNIDGVLDIHHLHLWQLDEKSCGLEAHVVIDERRAMNLDRIKKEIKQKLVEAFAVRHPMLEFEYPHVHADEDCPLE